jgi:hypothetical protein
MSRGRQTRYLRPSELEEDVKLPFGVQIKFSLETTRLYWRFNGFVVV